MARARNWREVRQEALQDGRITKHGIAEARFRHDQQIHAYNLRRLREQRAALQSDIAAEMGVSQSRVSRIERGDRARTELGTLSAYVQALGGWLEVTACFADLALTLGTPGPDLAAEKPRPHRTRARSSLAATRPVAQTATRDTQPAIQSPNADELVATAGAHRTTSLAGAS